MKVEVSNIYRISKKKKKVTKLFFTKIIKYVFLFICELTF